jgi:predicted phosphodiesterase
MKLVALADIHSGDSLGLANPASVPANKPGHEFAKLLFDWYVSKIAEIGKPDIVVCAGELTEGPGSKDTIELWSTDMEEQVEACVDLLMMWGAGEYYLCYSSAYHAGKEQNTDHQVVRELQARGAHATVKVTQRLLVDGVRINVHHKVGGSSTAYGFASQLLKAGAVDVARGAYRKYESADLYLRGHTHIYGYAGNDQFTVYNCPSLKWPLGRYGRGIDRVYYAMGLLEIDVTAGKWDVQEHIFRCKLPEEDYVEISGRGGGGDKPGVAGKD